ncbi:FMN-binding protein [Methylomagnum ishizawai]|uniref:FMN-binding protein n=1 Tax=Methylomagnum ishizawai TaxID=1760988 RepID=UPI001C3319BC|nr:FMN-binding protein [Methylomagnum ishizawai]BBL76253.1 hypothetical protein MishRS11D_33510 [Methylomagnum ishizawai]
MRNYLTAVFLFLAIAAPTALGMVYYSKEEAFELAFGKEAEIETQPVFLSDEQAAEVEKTAQAKLEGHLFTFYVGKKGGQILGYAALESHTVRTQPEMLLVVLSPAGELVRAEILAFHEPPEYQPPARWFERLYKRPLQELKLNQGVDGISGATLSSRAALDSLRKVMAIHKIALREEVR